MADFRKWFVLLAMLTLFTGVALADNPPFSCTAVAQVTPTVRTEGLTEMVGDIVLQCTGGNSIAPGTQIPQANIIVNFSAPVTSRLATTTAQALSPNGLPNEALLLIDEPGAPISAPVAGFGPAAPLTICTSLNGGCTEFATSAPLVAGGTTTVATQSGGAVGWNVFQGVVPTQNSYQVIFAGVPILPPGTTGLSRTYRITNVRVNMGGAQTGSIVGGLIPVQAYIFTSGSTSLPVVNNQLTVAYGQNSLSTSLKATSTVFTQCNGTQAIDATTTGNPLGVAILNFSELFPSAFKTRVAALSTNAGASYLATNYGAPGTNTPIVSGGANQNVPGQLYNSESGLIIPVPGGPGAMTGNSAPGLASNGTRLKAVFSNIPAGVTLYVSRYNVNTLATNGGGGYLSASALTDATASARLTSSETGTFSAPNIPSGTTTLFAYGSGGVEVLALGSSNTAVWEVTNSNVAANETLSFAVYMAFTPSGTPISSPAITSAANAPSVTLSYAPSPSSSDQATSWALAQPFSTGSGGSAVNYPVPRFGRVTTPTGSLGFAIVPCQTVLLFPFVTSAANMNTGIAISNTGLDPLTPTTGAGQGFCTLYFYGHNASGTQIKPTSTPPKVPSSATNPNGLVAGDTTAFTIYDQFGANVSGYMFAACDFQYAHGFAYISDFGNTNLAMGYLALIVNNGDKLLGRPGAQSGEALNQ